MGMYMDYIWSLWEGIMRIWIDMEYIWKGMDILI